MVCRLSTCACSVHLVDELVLLFYTTFCWGLCFGGWWAGEYGFSILGVNAILIYLFIYFIILLFTYSFLVKSLFTIKHKYYKIFNLESHSKDLVLLKLRYILVTSTGSVKYPLTLFRMDFFGAAHGWGQKQPPSRKSVTYILQWWNLTQLYLPQKRSKKYLNHVTQLLSSADISIFSPEISKFCYIRK